MFVFLFGVSSILVAGGQSTYQGTYKGDVLAQCTDWMVGVPGHLPVYDLVHDLEPDACRWGLESTGPDWVSGGGSASLEDFLATSS